MKRVLALVGAVVLGLAVLVPSALAADPLSHTGRVLISTDGNISIPAGEHADVVVVVNGNADIRGEVNTLVVVDGTANLAGATLETVVAVRGQVEIGAGTVVYGEVQRLDSTVHQTGNPQIQGGIVDLGGRLFAFERAVGSALTLLWLGFGLATFVVGLLFAALAGRQIRSATTTISREPVLAGLTGVIAAIVIPVVAILLLPTVIGAPLGLGILFVALPIVAFGGYLVAAVWVGDWILRFAGSTQVRDRPYLPVMLGVVILGGIGLVPVLGILVALASLFGLGAVIVQAIRTISIGSRPAPDRTPPMPAASPA